MPRGDKSKYTDKEKPGGGGATILKRKRHV